MREIEYIHMRSRTYIQVCKCGQNIFSAYWGWSGNYLNVILIFVWSIFCKAPDKVVTDGVVWKMVLVA
jgi:hypothetical protein